MTITEYKVDSTGNLMGGGSTQNLVINSTASSELALCKECIDTVGNGCSRVVHGIWQNNGFFSGIVSADPFMSFVALFCSFNAGNSIRVYTSSDYFVNNISNFRVNA